jgi:hypothetical protein
VAASLAAMLRGRGRVGRARVIGSSGAFAWGDGHEPARELVGWVSGGSVGRRRRGGRWRGRGGRWRGINTAEGVVGSPEASARGGQGRAHVHRDTWGRDQGLFRQEDPYVCDVVLNKSVDCVHVLRE